MKRLLSVAGIAAAVLAQGCTTPSVSSVAAPSEPVSLTQTFADSNAVSAVAMCSGSDGCERNGAELAHGDAIGMEKNAPVVQGRPLTSVVVTQCNLVVAVYMTMPDGRLLRFDNKAEIAADKLVGMAYTATRSERVEVSCEGMGPASYEAHGPV